MTTITLDCAISKRVMARLKEEKIRFSIVSTDSGVRDIPMTLRPTRFGLGAKVTIRVAYSDLEAVDAICMAIMAPHQEQEVRPRVPITERPWYRWLFGLNSRKDDPS